MLHENLSHKHRVLGLYLSRQSAYLALMKPWVQSPAVHKSVVVMPACNLVTWGGARRSEANLERDLISEREQENHLGDSLSEQWMADPHDFQVSSLSLDAPGMCCLYALIPLPIFQS